jgi:hypothetical protein
MLLLSERSVVEQYGKNAAYKQNFENILHSLIYFEQNYCKMMQFGFTVAAIIVPF